MPARTASGPRRPGHRPPPRCEPTSPQSDRRCADRRRRAQTVTWPAAPRPDSRQDGSSPSPRGPSGSRGGRPRRTPQTLCCSPARGRPAVWSMTAGSPACPGSSEVGRPRDARGRRRRTAPPVPRGLSAGGARGRGTRCPVGHGPPGHALWRTGRSDPPPRWRRCALRGGRRRRCSSPRGAAARRCGAPSVRAASGGRAMSVVRVGAVPRSPRRVPGGRRGRRRRSCRPLCPAPCRRTAARRRAGSCGAPRAPQPSARRPARPWTSSPRYR
jgi:hypothetical protein